MTRQRIHGSTKSSNDSDTPFYIQKIDNAFRRYDNECNLCGKKTFNQFDPSNKYWDKHLDKIDRDLNKIDARLDLILQNVLLTNKYLGFFFKTFLSTLTILFVYTLFHSH